MARHQTDLIEANAQPSVLVRRGAGIVAYLAISTSQRGIDQLLWVLSPAKLHGISKLLPASGDVS